MPPGAGWPDDPGSPDTPVARTPAQVRRRASAAVRDDDLGGLTAEISVCRACPRLVTWREDVAHAKRAAYAEEPYWGRPIAGWGAVDARLLVVGLAPAAHGGNRTGRVFTGDRSGDWIYAGLHRAGLASQATSVHAGDGLALPDVRVVAAVRCAPPDNRPTTVERDTCAPWIEAELTLLAPRLRVVLALGSIAWDVTLRTARAIGWTVPRPKPRFGHGAEAVLTGVANDASGEVLLLGSYHPSQQNTFTGRLTGPMLDEVLARAAAARMPA